MNVRRLLSFRYDISHQSLVNGGCADCRNHRRLYSRVLRENGFNFTQLDPVPLNFDLEIVATEKFYVAVGKIAPLISGAIQALSRPGMVDKASACFFFVAPVSFREPDPADVKLAGNPNGAGFQRVIK